MAFAAMMIAPSYSAMASINPAPMMAMADGSPCSPEDCATMPDCAMTLPGGVGLFAVPAPDLSALPVSHISSDVFVITDVAAGRSILADGLRRPPRI